MNMSSMKHKIILKAPNLKAVNSVRELRSAQRKTVDFEAQQDVRRQATDIVDGCMAWIQRAASYNQRPEDHAQHDTNLTVLDRVPTPVHNGTTSWYGDLSGEIKFEADGKTPKSASVQVDDSLFGYRKNGLRETFTQNENGVLTTVVLDHGKNVLTWEY